MREDHRDPGKEGNKITKKLQIKIQKLAKTKGNKAGIQNKHQVNWRDGLAS